MAAAGAVELESLVVRLVGDATQYLQMLSQSAKHTQETAKQIEGHANRIERFADTVKGYGRTILGALGAVGVVGMLKSSFSAFEGAETRQVKLTSAIEAGGHAVEAVMPQYEAFAKQISNVTTSSKGEVFALLRMAESMGVSGSEAQDMVQQSLSLSAASDHSAESIMFGINALKNGSPEVLKHMLHLRGLKDESKLMDIIQQRLNSGWKQAQAVTQTSEGAIKKMGQATEALKVQFGGLVAKALQPVIVFTTNFLKALQNLNPETRQLIINIGLATAAFLTLGPALTIAGAAVYWFGSQWPGVQDDFDKAWNGIKDAVASGDLKLAFEIVWAQIKLSFVRAQAKLGGDWEGFIIGLKVAWNDFATFFQKSWENIREGLTRGWIATKEFFGTISKEQADAERTAAAQRLGEQLKALEQEKIAYRIAQFDKGAAAQAAAQKEIDDLVAQRDRLVGQAKEEADRVSAANQKVTPPPLPDFKKATEEIKKFDAALSGSVDAYSRVAEYSEKEKERMESIAGNRPKSFNPTATEGTLAGGALLGGAALDPTNQILSDIRDILEHPEKNRGAAIKIGDTIDLQL